MKKIILLTFIPIYLFPLISFSQSIAEGNTHSLAICSNGTVKAWGSNFDGELGNGTNTDSNIPVQVNNLTTVIAVTGGGYHSLALKSDGTVWACGRNYDGELGNGNYNNSNVPVQVSILSGVIALTSGGGWFHSLALKNDSTVWAWGKNDYGQLGNGNTN